jgi:uncharacterized membrane protein YdbT with pleckstrin-like domain
MEARPDPEFDDAAIHAIHRPHRNLLLLYALQSLAGTLLAPIVFVPFFFKYHTLRYSLDDEGISASWGILFRREIHLTYKRIQDIHVKRNFIERWLGIATVEIQTASGSASAELSLEGMEHYERVRDYLYRRMRGHAGSSVHAGVAPAADAGERSTDELVGLLNAMRDDLDGARRALERTTPGAGEEA